MKTLPLAALILLAAAGCTSAQEPVNGGAVGAGIGAVVGRPVGAVVGGVVGAATGPASRRGSPAAVAERPVSASSPRPP